METSPVCSSVGSSPHPLAYYSSPPRKQGREEITYVDKRAGCSFVPNNLLKTASTNAYEDYRAGKSIPFVLKNAFKKNTDECQEAYKERYWMEKNVHPFLEDAFDKTGKDLLPNSIYKAIRTYCMEKNIHPLLETAFDKAYKGHLPEEMFLTKEIAQFILESVICQTPTEDLLPFLPSASGENEAVIVDLTSEDQELAFNLRIQGIWQQFLLCYQTGLYFSETEHTPKAQGIVGKGNTEKNYQAAHSWTLPRLVLPLNGQEYVLGGATFFYDAGNTTILFPKAVNDVDSALDSHNDKLGVEQALRKRSLRLLDQVAKKTDGYTPAQALEKFLLCCDELLRAFAHAQNVKPCQQLVARNYLTVVRSYQKAIREEAGFINKLCFCKGSVNERFYLFIQGEMLGIARINTQPAEKHKITHAFTILGHPIAIEITKVTSQYTDLCISSEKIRNLAKGYLDKQDKKIALSDLKQLNNSGGVKALQKLKDLSQSMKDLLQICNDYIMDKARLKKNPKRITVIVQHLLALIEADKTH